MRDEIGLNLEDQSIDATPGALVLVNASLVNGTDSARTLRVTFLGDLAPWASAEPAQLLLAAGEEISLRIVIAAAADASIGTAGVLGVRVADVGDPMVSRVEEIRIRVRPPSDGPTTVLPAIDDTIPMPVVESTPAPPPPPEVSAPPPVTPPTPVPPVVTPSPPATPPPPSKSTPPPGPGRAARGDIRVSISPPVASIAPGGTVALDVRVFNATDIVDEFAMTTIGLDSDFMTTEPDRLSLFPGKEATARAVIAIPSGAAIVSGPHTIGIKVTSVTNPAVTRVEEFELNVQAVGGATLTLEPQTVRAGGRARVTGTLANNGNLPLSVSLRGHDSEQAIAFTFEPQNVVVPPFGVASSRIRMKAPRPWTGRPQPRMFEVRADDISTTGTIIQRPRIPLVVVRLASAMLGLGALAGIALSIPSVRESVFPPETTTTLPPTAAAITSFGPVGDVSADGCAEFAWNVDEAVEVTLKTPRSEFDVSAVGSQEICGADGDVFTLEALGEDGQIDDRSHTLGVSLVVGDVQARVQGRTVIFDVDTNQAADVNIALVGRAVDKTSSGRSTHHLEFDDESSGQVEWRLTASLPGQPDTVDSGTIALPFYSIRVSVVSDPIFTSNAPPPTFGLDGVTGDADLFDQAVSTLDFVTIAVDSNFFVPASYWFPYAAQPVPRFMGEDCPGQYAGQTVEQLILPLEPDGSAEVSFNVDLCSGFATGVQPLPEDPVTGQSIKIAPGFDELTGEKELVFPASNGFETGTVSMVVRIERITTPDRPDYP